MGSDVSSGIQRAESGPSLVSTQAWALARGGLTAFAIRISAAGLLFLLQMTLAQTLGLDGYGEYAYALAWMDAIGTFAGLGLKTTSLRYVAQYRARQETSLLRGFLRRSMHIGMASGAAASVGLAVAAWILRDQMSHGLLLCFALAAVLIPVTTLTGIRDATLRAFGRVGQGLASILVWRGLLLILLLVTTRIIGLAISSSTAMLLHLMSALAALAVASVFLGRTRPRSVGPTTIEYDTGQWLSTALPLMLLTVLIFVQGQSGTILCGLFLGTADAGLYAAVARISGLTLFGYQSINAFAAPMFAALYASRRRLELQRLVRLCAWASAALTLALTALLIVFGKTVVGLLGEEFDAGYPVLVVLLLGAAASATTGSAAVLLTMTNHQGLSVKVFAGGTAINIVLSAILIPRYGVLGTAVANAISTAACSVVLVYLVKKRLGIWSVIGRLP